MMDSNNKSPLKSYIIGGVIGITAYVLAPVVLSNVGHNNSDERARILDQVGMMIQSENLQHQSQLQSLENKIDAMSGRISTVSENGYNQGYPEIPEQRTALYRDLPYSSRYSGENQVEMQQLPSPQSSYPAHDIYFSWQARDNGVTQSKRSYQISLSTGKIMESMAKMGEWFKHLVTRN